MISQLHEAAASGDRKTLRHLLKTGVSTEGQDERGRTPLLLAAENGHWQVAQELIAHGAVVEARDQNGHTPLMLAASHGYGDAVRLLAERGAALEARNPDGQTALTLAASTAPVDVGVNGVFRLAGGNVDGIAALLDVGADIEAADDDGYTPLLMACASGHLQAVEVLVRRGARLDARTRSGHTALSCGPESPLPVRSGMLSLRLKRIAALLREAGLTE